jgi:hypothetical protein
MTKIEWTIIKPENPKQFFWRYLTFEKFENLIKSSELYLRRLDKFSDNYEGKLGSFTAKKINNLFDDFSNSQEMERELFYSLKNLRTCIFTNCWHINENENIDMWKSYCHENEGVVIKTNIDNLISSILPHSLGPMHFRPVTYGNTDDTNIDLRFPLELINFKGNQYSFENEYRISLFYIKGEKEIEQLEEFEELIITPPEEAVKLKVNLKKLLNEIRISPFANAEFHQRVSELCENYLDIEPKESQLKII